MDLSVPPNPVILSPLSPCKSAMDARPRRNSSSGRRVYPVATFRPMMRCSILGVAHFRRCLAGQTNIVAWFQFATW
jgi:hypothetical protein